MLGLTNMELNSYAVMFHLNWKRILLYINITCVHAYVHTHIDLAIRPYCTGCSRSSRRFFNMWKIVVWH